MLLSLILSSTFASAQATPNREQVTLRGTVQAVDVNARTITIRGEDGNVATLDVPKSVERLNEVKVGDVVSAVYYDQVSVALHPAGAPNNDRLEPPIATPTPGALPGGTVAQRRVTTVTITAWDPATRVVTFTVPSGDVLLAPSGGNDRREPHERAQGWRSRGRDADRSGSRRSRARDAGGCPRHFAQSAHCVGAVRVGQPVQRQDDQAGDRTDHGRGADQPRRDDLRRGVRQDWHLQDRRRLPDHSAHRGRAQLHLVQQ